MSKCYLCSNINEINDPYPVDEILFDENTDLFFLVGERIGDYNFEMEIKYCPICGRKL